MTMPNQNISLPRIVIRKIEQMGFKQDGNRWIYESPNGRAVIDMTEIIGNGAAAAQIAAERVMNCNGMDIILGVAKVE